MRNNTFAIAMSLLLVGCRYTPTDAELQRQLVGTWRLDQEPSKTIQNKPDGSYILQFARNGSNMVAEGMWQVKGGFVIAMMTNAPSWYGPQDPAARQRAESNKVVRIDAHKMTILSSQDNRTVLTAHKE